MKKNYLLTVFTGLIIAVSGYSCNDCDCDDDTTGAESFIGSYDFTVSIQGLEWNNASQSCDSSNSSSTHIITINTQSGLAPNQLVIKNLVANANQDIIVDVTDDAFVISDPGYFSGTGVKTGNAIQIQYTEQEDWCYVHTGNGTAVRR